VKKKILLAMCVAIIIPSSIHADTGIWITKHYVDEFKQPTDDAYITTDVINGTFSNSAATDALLQVIPLIDDKHVTFQLWEYGQIKVVGYLSSGQDFDITVLAPDGSKTAMKGYLNDGVDRVVLYDSYVPYFFDILNQNGPVSILMKSGRSSYLFTLEDTTGIKEEYLNSFEDMPHHDTGTAEEIKVEMKESVSYYDKWVTVGDVVSTIYLSIDTNLPDDVVLTASASSSGSKYGESSGTVKDGHCDIELTAKTEYGANMIIVTNIKFGKQPESVTELYGDSLEKITGEISDKLKSYGHSASFTIEMDYNTLMGPYAENEK